LVVACCLWLASSLCLVPRSTGTYAGKLLEEVRRATHSARCSDSAPPREVGAAVVVAATEPATVGAPADPADLGREQEWRYHGRAEPAATASRFGLPLRDVLGRYGRALAAQLHIPGGRRSHRTRAQRRGNSRPACHRRSRTPVICSTRIHTNPARQQYLRTAAGR